MISSRSLADGARGAASFLAASRTMASMARSKTSPFGWNVGYAGLFSPNRQLPPSHFVSISNCYRPTRRLEHCPVIRWRRRGALGNLIIRYLQ